MTGNVPFLMKDVVLLAGSLYLLEAGRAPRREAIIRACVEQSRTSYGIAIGAVQSIASAARSTGFVKI